MSSLEDSVFQLEKTFSLLSGFVENLKSEKNYLSDELSKKEVVFNNFSKYKDLTLKKLYLIRRALADEMQIEIPEPAKEKPKKNVGLNILMLDDE